jgi:hypothetical protein
MPRRYTSRSKTPKLVVFARGASMLDARRSAAARRDHQS